MSLQHSYAVQHGIVVPESDLDPKVQAILRRMSQVAYVLDQHRLAVAKHTRHLAELRAQLERIEGER